MSSGRVREPEVTWTAEERVKRLTDIAASWSPLPSRTDDRHGRNGKAVDFALIDCQFGKRRAHALEYPFGQQRDDLEAHMGVAGVK